MANLTRIKNNQITDSTIWANAKIIPGSIVGSLFSSNIVVTSDFVITGNLYVAGASTYLTVASTNTFVNDPLIVLNNAYTGGGIYDIGFIFERGTDDNQAFYWDESTDEFKLIATSEGGSTYGNIGTEISYSNFRLGNLFLNNYVAGRALFIGSSGLITSESDYTYDSTDNILKVGNFQFRGNTSTIATTGTDESITLLPSGTGIIDASGFNLGNLAAPVSGDDAVTLTYLNSQISSAVTTIKNDDTEVRITDDGADAGQINANVDATSALVIKSNSISILGSGYTGSSPKVFIDGANSNVAITSKLFVTDVATLNSRAIISSTVPASSYTTGAVTVQGGVGIGGNLYVGAGIQDTIIGNTTAAAGFFTNLNATGNLQVATVNASFLSASTATVGNISAVNFGNAGATFTGGSLNVTGNVLANTVTAYALGGIITTASQTNITAVGTLGSLNVTGNVSAAELNIGTVKATGFINTTGNVSAATVIAGQFNTTGNLVASEVSTGTLNATGLINTLGNLVASQVSTGTLNATGLINTAGNLVASQVSTGTLNATGLINTTGNVSAATVIAGQFNTTGNLVAAEVSTGTLNATGLINTAGNLVASQVSTGSLNATGLINTAGNVIGATASFGAINSTGLINTSGNILGSAGTLSTLDLNSTTNATDASGTNGALQVSGGVSIAKDVWVGGNLYVANLFGVTEQIIAVQDPLLYLTASNLYPATYDIGIFSQFIGGAGNIYQHTGFVRDATDGVWKLFSNVVTEPTSIITFNGTEIYDGLKIGNLVLTETGTAISAAGYINTTANISAAVGNFGAVNLTGFFNTSGNISGAVVNTGALNVTGTSTLDAVNSTGFINTTGNISGAVLNGGAINSTGLINTTGNISGATVIAGQFNTTGNVLANTVTAYALGGIITTASQTNITAVGTLGSLNVTGNVSAAELNIGTVKATGFINTTANISAAVVNGGAINSTGLINTTGNLVAAEVSTGTLNATGFINTTGNISGAVLNGGAINSTGLINTTGNISGATVIAGQFNTTGNLVAAEVSTGTLNATGLINTTGNLSAATVIAGQFNTTGNVLANTVTAYALGGIITTASQTNITAVGTLGSLNVTANVSAAELNIGTVKATGLINTTGNVSAATVIAGQFNTTGNLVASEVSTGTLNATGLINTLGNISASRINADTLAATGTIWANAATDTTSLTTGALIVNGGAAVGKTMWVGEGARINSSQSAESFYVLGQGSGSSLIYADFAKNAIVFGGANTAVQDGAVAKFNSTGAIVVPVGSNAERPGAAGNVDVAGMLRFNNTSNGLEYYDGTAWAVAGSEFTIISTNSFSGNGVQTVFTLSSSSTTAGTLVMINGVVQIPTTAYSVSGTTLTFTEAPATGDSIDARTLVTTATVSAISSGNGFNNFDVATAPYANITAGTSAATVRVSVDGVTGRVTFTNDVTINGSLTVLGDTNGNINIGNEPGDRLQLRGKTVYDQTAINVPNTNLRELDSFSTSAFTTARYTVQVKNGGSVSAAELIVSHDGATSNIATYAVISTLPGTFESNISSGTVRVFYVPSGAQNANIKLLTTYIV